MQIKSSDSFPFGGPQNDGGDDDRGPSGIYVLLCLVGIALACAGGYSLVMKLIDISRQEDCVLTGRRNCMPPIEMPLRR
jgi:hypothetical protein